MSEDPNSSRNVLRFFSQGSENTQKWFDNLFRILLLLGSPIGIFIAIITGINLIAENPPAQMMWLPSAVVPISCLLTIAIACIVYLVYLLTKRQLWTAGCATGLTAFVSAGMLVCYVATVAVPMQGLQGNRNMTAEPIMATQAELQQLRRDLLARQLNETQVDQVIQIVTTYMDEAGVLTSADAERFVDANELSARLNNAGLNELQSSEVRRYLSESGFLTAPEVLDVIRGEATQIAVNQINATATAQAEACYITPKDRYSNIAIRPIPSEEANLPIDFLYRGERLQVIGHNSRNAEIAKWWLVSFDRGAGVVQGWVLSDVADVLNPVGCARMQPIPGT